MFDPVPWFVGGGAQHSPEVARLLAYASTNGAEGIVTPGDMKVTPLDVPGTAVRVLPGAALILNRGAGGAQQTYAARLPVADQVAIAATGSGAGRTDLIVAQVEDPYTAGEPWQAPTDPTVGPYVFARVISGVPAGTTRLQDVPGYEGRSAITLARVTLPASTGTVTAAMITDLRKVALPRSMPALRTYALVAGNDETLTATASAGEVWPNASTNAWEQLHIPEWASRMRIVATWAGVFVPPGNAWGKAWVQVGGYGAGESIVTQATGWDTPGLTENSRQVIVAADDRAIPKSLRGTSQRVYPMAKLDGTSNAAARPKLTAVSSMVLQIEFYETAI